MTTSQPPQGGVAIPARTIPTPHSVSAEAQAFLSRGLQISPPEIALDDLAGWRAYIAQVESYLAGTTQAKVQAYPAEITEHRLSAASLYEVTPETLSPSQGEKIIFYIHGGAFIVGGGRTAAYAGQPLASVAAMRLFAIDYRMPPNHPFPTGLDDVVEAYQFLIERFSPERIAFHGSSAGANIAAACILKARDMGLPLPGACVLHTAAVDLTQSGDTFETNALIDVVLRTSDNPALQLYAGGHDTRDPLLSPVFGDFSKGFPPTILLSGTRDLLLSSTVMMHRALRRAGIEADLHVFEAMPHGGFGNAAPEDQELLAETVRFIHKQLRMG